MHTLDQQIHNTPTFDDASKQTIYTQPPTYKYFSAFPPITAAMSPFSNTFGTNS
jgi:hypothetical protein